MAGLRIKWYGAKIINAAAKRVERNMYNACSFARHAIQNSMTISNLRGTRPSEPGMPPNVGPTRRLRSSVAFYVKRGTFSVTGYVGVTKKSDWIARRLEYGTEQIAQRPFVRPAIIMNRHEIGLRIAGSRR